MRTVIYLRTSTIDQHPENQLNDCLEFANSRGFSINKDNDIFIEKLSAWKKEVKRPLYEEIKQLAHEGKINAVIVWALDRWVRDRDSLLDDITFLTSRHVKIYSVKESYLEAVNIEGPIGKTIKDLLFGLIGSIAEIESQRKSERIKIAFQNHKKCDWGRPGISKSLELKVMQLRNQGLSIREIEAQKLEYKTKEGNIKYLKKSKINKIINHLIN